MHTQPLASRNADQNGCSDRKAPARSELRLTQEALETLMEETATRATTAAVNHFVASRQYRTTSSSDSFTRDTGREKKRTIDDTSISNRDIPKRSTPHDEDEGDSNVRRTSQRRAISKSRIPDNGSRTFNETRSSWGVLPARQSPFTNDILSETLPKGVKLTNLPDFNGTNDPQEHIDKFYAKADLVGDNGGSGCRFPGAQRKLKATGSDQFHGETGTSNARTDSPRRGDRNKSDHTKNRAMAAVDGRRRWAVGGGVRRVGEGVGGYES
ncbi:hypothetical protein F511_40935 [Dorcoceras hygrometricum]|uniref:Uncharacterized protein n=1 Tax=Dorcoceras hygrometricum TaxID=472368 RepID=A0A2Z7CN45_9LAMI|nr:hypothetical protein F511_40935 [Dorcoceras hygrometricum]